MLAWGCPSPVVLTRALNPLQVRCGGGPGPSSYPPLFIEPGSLWENGYVESCNGKLRDELRNGELFYTRLEVQVMIEQWRQRYNTKRPHSALRDRLPVPETRELRPPRLSA